MGWNTSLMIMNDALSNLETDRGFGKRLHSAILQMGGSPQKPIDVPIGGHVNGCLVIESHHADHCIPILVGGNHAWPIEKCFVRWSAADPERQLLHALAEKHGFELSLKRTRG